MILQIDFPFIRRAARHAGVLSKTLTAPLTPLFPRRAAVRGSIRTLSAHQLRDIGIEHRLRGSAAGFALADLIPRSTLFGHRTPR